MGGLRLVTTWGAPGETSSVHEAVVRDVVERATTCCAPRHKRTRPSRSDPRVRRPSINNSRGCPPPERSLLPPMLTPSLKLRRGPARRRATRAPGCAMCELDDASARDRLTPPWHGALGHEKPRTGIMNEKGRFFEDHMYTLTVLADHALAGKLPRRRDGAVPPCRRTGGRVET